MKLYAAVTSERASKGQGGNDYLEIEIKIEDRVNPRYHVRVNGSTFEVLDSEERVLFIEEYAKGERKGCEPCRDMYSRTPHTCQETKGEKQKGEVCEQHGDPVETCQRPHN